MQPTLIYKLGNRIRLMLHSDPPGLQIILNEKEDTFLNLGDWFDLVRFLTMFTAKQQNMLGSMSGRPVALTGKKTIERLTSSFPEAEGQMDMFKEPESEAEVEPVKSEPVLAAIRQRKLEIVARLTKQPNQHKLIEELAYLESLLT